MKHFVVEITYTVGMDVISTILDQHRAHLKTGYEQGLLLCSGPMNPRTGGIAIARAGSLEEIKEFFNRDPYQKNHAASYRFVEFDPVLRQNLLEDWMQG